MILLQIQHGELGLMKLSSNPLGELCWKCKESEDVTPQKI